MSRIGGRIRRAVMKRRQALGKVVLRLRLAGSSPAGAFATGWAFVERHSWLFPAPGLEAGRFPIPGRHHRLIRLLQVLRWRDRSFRPPVTVIGADLIAGLDPLRPNAVLVTAHTGLSMVLHRILADAGLTSAVIVANLDKPGEHADLFSANPDVDLIGRTRGALIAARRRLRDGRVVFSAADYATRAGPEEPFERHLGTGLFAFAARAGAELIYGLPCVDPDGTVVVHLARPGLSTQAATPEALAEDFIAFVRRTSGSAYEVRIRRWAFAD